MRRALGGFIIDENPAPDPYIDELRRAQIAETGALRFTIGKLLRRMERLMHTLDDVLANVTAQRTAIDSLATLTAGIKKQLDEALGGELTPSQQMRVDAIFNKVDENKQAIVDAINANDGDPNTPPISIIPTHTTVASSNARANVGDPVTFSAAVIKHPDAPADKVLTGTVSFAVDGTEIGSATLDGDGVGVSAAITTLAAGDHTVTATYAGNADFESSTSDSITQTVVAAVPQT